MVAAAVLSSGLPQLEGLKVICTGLGSAYEGEAGKGVLMKDIAWEYNSSNQKMPTMLHFPVPVQTVGGVYALVYGGRKLLAAPNRPPAVLSVPVYNKEGPETQPRWGEPDILVKLRQVNTVAGKHSDQAAAAAAAAAAARCLPVTARWAAASSRRAAQVQQPQHTAEGQPAQAAGQPTQQEQQTRAQQAQRPQQLQNQSKLVTSPEGGRNRVQPPADPTASATGPERGDGFTSPRGRGRRAGAKRQAEALPDPARPTTSKAATAAPDGGDANGNRFSSLAAAAMEEDTALATEEGIDSEHAADGMDSGQAADGMDPQPTA
jgi:hypothetical protein